MWPCDIMILSHLKNDLLDIFCTPSSSTKAWFTFGGGILMSACASFVIFGSIFTASIKYYKKLGRICPPNMYLLPLILAT